MAISPKALSQWPLKARFIYQTDYTPVGPMGCYLWTGAKDSKGYGKIFAFGRPRIAHRVAYELFVGEIPEGMHVLHACDTPLCVNPDHLRPGTDADNTRDRVDRDRTPRGDEHHKTKISTADLPWVHEMRRQGMSQSAIARAMGVTPAAIRFILLGKVHRRDQIELGLIKEGA